MPLSRRSFILPALISVLAVLALTLLPRGSQADTVAPVNATDGIAILGTDPVAYFTDKTTVPGDPAISAEWNGARWLFATEDHRARFLADPQAYAPQYGGYCAWAVSQGYTAPIDPEAWTVVGGRLYLNYSPKVQGKWSQDIPGNIGRADANWPKLSR